jgi:hypothetical protein
MHLGALRAQLRQRLLPVLSTLNRWLDQAQKNDCNQQGQCGQRKHPLFARGTFAPELAFK